MLDLSLVIELGARKDREKQWPGRELNLRPSQQITVAPLSELQGFTPGVVNRDTDNQYQSKMDIDFRYQLIENR